MKKLFAAMAAVLVCLTSCASKTQLGTFDELPNSAQAFVQSYYNPSDIAFIKIERDGLHNEYEVQLNNGVKIEFDYKGNLKDIDCKPQAVPDGIVPEKIVSYVASRFPAAFIVKYEKDRRHQKVELNNSLDLEFDLQGNFLRVDD